MKRLWTVTLAAAGCALATGLAWQVFAQQPAFPTRPIRMIFGFAPGGSGDLAARLLADVATKTLGQHVVMENRTGANGMIAAEAIARSSPDGYNVLYCTTGNMTIITELPGTKLAVNPVIESGNGSISHFLRCASQRAQTHSTRRMPWATSSRAATASGAIGCQNDGQPEPESYLVVLLNSAAPQQTQV